ncbi:MAG: phage terminase large subunit [Alphaproteobacteria bacterium]|nr:phage terminase large subunit [Alphaproteobacteria bacterium]
MAERVTSVFGGHTRATAMIENGFVYIPETAPWLADYLHEMTVFPKGKHDDQVDSTAQFLDWFKPPIAALGHLRGDPNKERPIPFRHLFS